jgi:single-strand DNA-binding protein
MASLNYVALMGNLVSDVELRQLESGMAVADLRLAVSERFKNKGGEMVEKTLFIDVVVWDRQAENCAKYLGKGSPVLVEGRLQMDEWTDKEGGKRSKIRVRADTVQFLGKPGGAGRDGDAPRRVQPGTSGGKDDLPSGTSDDDTPF